MKDPSVDRIDQLMQLGYSPELGYSDSSKKSAIRESCADGSAIVVGVGNLFDHGGCDWNMTTSCAVLELEDSHAEV